MSLKNLITLGLSAALAGSASAGTYSKEIVPVEPKTFCDVYEDFLDLFKIYESDTGFLRSFAFTGRYHGQLIHNSLNTGAFGELNRDYNDTDWENRRFRFGWKAALLDNFTFQGLFDLDTTWKDGDIRTPGNGPSTGETGFFQKIDVVDVEWKINKQLKFVIGKIDPKVTLEENMSSNRLYTVERTSVSNRAAHDKAAGAAIEIKQLLGNDFRFGVYNGGSEDDHNRGYQDGAPAVRTLQSQVSELPQTNGRWGYEFKLKRNLWSAPSGAKAPLSNLKSIDAGIFWFHAEDADQEYLDRRAIGVDDEFTPHTDVVSINTTTKGDRWGLFTDVILANPDSRIRNASDWTGLVIMPYYDITDKLQLVYRYQRGWSDTAVAPVTPGLQLDGRMSTDPAGALRNADSLYSHYFGLNYYICGHKLKIQTGVEYTNLENPVVGQVGQVNDFEYWSFQTGIRMHF